MAPTTTKSPIWMGFIRRFSPIYTDGPAANFVSTPKPAKITVSRRHANLPHPVLDRTGHSRAGYRPGAYGRGHRYRLPAVHPQPRRLRLDHDRIHQLARRSRVDGCA